MKLLFIAIAFGIFGCNSTKPVSTNEEGLSVTNQEETNSLPKCIKALIAQFKKDERTNPPRKIYSYTYKGSQVYYVPAVCCDNFSDLYDSKCNLIGYPDGGFTGKGDGKFKDFFTERANEKLIWADRRK